MQKEVAQRDATLLLKWELWADYTENVIFHLDSEMFPNETHFILSKTDIGGHIAYQHEREVYLFNRQNYAQDIEVMMHKHSVPFDAEFEEVKRSAAITAAFATRLRAWEVLKPPRRGLIETLRDDRIPWKVRRMLHKHPKLEADERRAKRGLRSLSTGCFFADDLDLTIISTLASYGYRNNMSPEWLRPFILT